MPNNAKTLPNVLNGRRFVVPDYQRPYAWEKRQLDELWQDIDLMPDGSKHYTGTLVLKDLDDELVTDAGDTLVACEVVDGQQRLTTCLILLDQLRRALSRLDHEGARDKAKNLERTYGRVLVNGLPQARLRLGEDLNEHWLHVILGDQQQVKPSLTVGEQRLGNAAAFFAERIGELVAGRSVEEAVGVLQRLQTRVTNGLRFLTYEVEPTSHAGEIFETLNGRGRELTEMEKIKNYLLFLANGLTGQAKEGLAGDINGSWSRIYELLAQQGADEDTLLRAHWLALHEPMAKFWKGSVSVKERFARERYVSGTSRLSGQETGSSEGDSRVLAQEVQRYVRTLEQCAMFTAEFLSRDAGYQAFGGPEATASARRSAARLRRTGVTAAFRPLLFAARLSRPEDGDFYVELLDACERYAARVFIIGQRRSNSGQARLYRLAYELHQGAIEPATVLAEIEALTWYYANDDVVRSGLGPSQNWYWRSHKYFLYEYELAQARREDDVPPFETFASGSRKGRTTEHILPQNPDWDSAEWQAFTPEQHKELVHGIGNLALTDDNSSYGRKAFARKKGTRDSQVPCYTTSRLVQERELATLSDWTPATLEERRARLEAWALQRWHVEPPTAAAPDDGTIDEDAGAETLPEDAATE
ncbi:DUF262 domain-containing protein [Arsenicicoccus dermatophilus]|uniref:DUF262 domain-containing protein n=1 Tax=Arsenicicoccus dermatophilus TaxID=1076331 RepID=UPI0039175370